MHYALIALGHTLARCSNRLEMFLMPVKRN